jgi:hypothetical protein
MRLRAALACRCRRRAGSAAGLAGTANAEAVCSHDLRVLAQPRDGLTLVEIQGRVQEGLWRVLQH